MAEALFEEEDGQQVSEKFMQRRQNVLNTAVAAFAAVVESLCRISFYFLSSWQGIDNPGTFCL